MDNIKKTSNRYALQVLILANALLLGCYLVECFAGLSFSLLAPMAVGYGFHLLSAFLFILLWRKVAISSPESLTSVYMATSGFRMLLALATLLVVFIVVGRAQMMPFAIVFMIFYLAAVAHHSVFFARINNQQ